MTIRQITDVLCCNGIPYDIRHVGCIRCVEIKNSSHRIHIYSGYSNGVLNPLRMIYVSVDYELLRLTIEEIIKLAKE